MRPAALALVLFACTPVDRPPDVRAAPPPPTTRTLALPGITLTIPAAWVQLEQDRIDDILAGARKESPNGEISVDGARDPAGLAHGLLYVQRIVNLRDAAVRPLSVRRSLLRLRDELYIRTISPDLDVSRFDLEIQGDALVGAVNLHMRQGDLTVEIRSHLHIALLDDRHILLRSVTCMDDAADADAVCDPKLATREFADTTILPLDHILPANTPPPTPLADIGPHNVAGVVFGASRDEFTDACTRAGLTVGGFDETRDPPDFRDLHTTGQVARCSGLPTVPGAPPFGLGRVLETFAVFLDGKLAVATLQLEAEADTTDKRLGAAWPEAFTALMGVHHRIDDDATDDQLLRVRLGFDEPMAGARSVVHFVSRRGADGPPLATP